MTKRLGILTLAVLLLAGNIFASAQQKLEEAAKSGKVAFILVYDATATTLEQARQLTAQAVGRVPGSISIELNRGDAAEADFVKRYGLATAPVPLVLVTSTNGIITGAAIAAQANVDQLVGLVPSPKKAEIIKALSAGNAVFITASRKGMATTAAVNTCCASASQQMGGKCVQVSVDMDDPAEADFLKSMKVNVQSTEPITLVANTQGQISGMYTGAMQVTDLVTAATKKVGGCCPSTVAKPDASCAPAPKK